MVFFFLPEATARQRQEAQQGQQHPERQQGEDVQEGVQTQEEAKQHQLKQTETHRRPPSSEEKGENKKHND